MPGRGRATPRGCARAWVVACAALVLAAVVGCQAEADTTKDQARRAEVAQVGKSVPPAKITVKPADNTVDVPLDAAVTVRVSGGTLRDITVTAANGTKLSGTLDQRKTVWRSEGPLLPDSVYRVQATALNAEGYPTEIDQTFGTLKPTKPLDVDVFPLAGSTVGVGQPIQVRFDEPVGNRAKVERRLTVETSKPVEGSWHWFSDQEVRFRPKEYWPAHTKVTLRADLRGIRAEGGAWGLEKIVHKFTIANSVVTKVDLATHQARVYIDGELARTIPVTGGKPGWETRDGTKVILAKETNKVFTNESINAPEEYELLSPWALRVTWSGEFLHTASWSVGSHGRANVSHGCVGMNLDNSRWLWHVSHIGDPVEVHSPGGTPMEPSNGFGDWNFSWEDYKAGSALRD